MYTKMKFKTLAAATLLSALSMQSIAANDNYEGNAMAEDIPVPTYEVCVTRSALGNAIWAQNDSLWTDNQQLGFNITRYQIQWFNGNWSGNYYPGANDVDWKTTPTGAARRVWSYFSDHNHKYCYTKKIDRCDLLPISDQPVGNEERSIAYREECPW
ncbi:MAG: hypothetical protein MJK04_17105 [Psychrosphaera sp.]|nr:hypothetical protein [Psychrosphaera sp.]